MIEHGFMPYISKPTRITHSSATIIDHIYSNENSSHTNSGIIITDVANHFATFYIMHKKVKTKQKQDTVEDRMHSKKEDNHFQ
jgi:hypothetical protein